MNSKATENSRLVLDATVSRHNN